MNGSNHLAERASRPTSSLPSLLAKIVFLRNALLKGGFLITPPFPPS